MKRRDFIAALGGAAAWPVAALGQQPAMPVVGFVNGGSPEGMARYAAAFRSALNKSGYVEGQNVTVEYHWLDGHYDRVPAIIADIVRHRVAVIAAPGPLGQRSLPKPQPRRSRSSLAAGMTPSSLV